MLDNNSTFEKLNLINHLSIDTLNFLNGLSAKDLDIISKLSFATSDIDKYVVLLKNDYGYSLTKSQLAIVLRKSEQTIDRRIKEASNVPSYIRSSEGAKASYIFPVIEVAKYLCDTIEVF